jgi:hypothetical protein
MPVCLTCHPREEPSRDAELHLIVFTWGFYHTALRLKTATEDVLYNFGGYDQTTGQSNVCGFEVNLHGGAQKQGILYVGSGNGEQQHPNTDFMWKITEAQAQKVHDFYASLLASAKQRTDAKGNPCWQLARDYDLLTNNCTSQSIDAAKHALPNIDAGSASFINMDHLPPLPVDPRVERVLAEIFNPHRLFNGRDLVDYLQTKPAVPPDRVQVNP